MYFSAATALSKGMEFVPLMIIPLVLAVVVKLATAWRERRRTRKPASAAPARELYEPPTFDVIALGAKSSGKTVFLSSMFHKLNFQAPGRSYYLETDPQQRIALARTYSNVSDTAKPWPPGTRTGETREFVFDCVGVDEHNAKHTVLQLRCLDYAGEALEYEQEAGSTVLDDLAERIQRAHALLGMIDGHRVLQLLRNEPAGHDYFERSLRPMLGFMHGASCPIHLVLTKWDLLRDNAPASSGDDEALLDAVIAALMRYDHIKALVYVHSRNQIVRLIPVSAVGSAFAHLDPEGKVVKRPDGELRPTNVEVPLCAVLPDLLQAGRDVAGPVGAQRRQRRHASADAKGRRDHGCQRPRPSRRHGAATVPPGRARTGRRIRGHDAVSRLAG